MGLLSAEIRNLQHCLSLQATINIVFDRVGKTDPVTRGIEITVNYLGIQFDVSSLVGRSSIFFSQMNILSGAGILVFILT